MTAAVGSLRAARLLIGLRLRQQVNRIVSVYRHRWGAKKRAGTGRKSRTGWLIGLWVGVSMVIAISQISYNSVVNMERETRIAEARAFLQRAPAPDNPGGVIGRGARAPGASAGGARPSGAIRYPGLARGYAWPAGVILRRPPTSSHRLR